MQESYSVSYTRSSDHLDDALQAGEGNTSPQSGEKNPSDESHKISSFRDSLMSTRTQTPIKKPSVSTSLENPDEAFGQHTDPFVICPYFSFFPETTGICELQKFACSEGGRKAAQTFYDSSIKFPIKCVSVAEREFDRFLRLANAAKRELGVLGVMVLIYGILGTLSLLLCVVASWFLGLRIANQSAWRVVCYIPLLGPPLGVASWAIISLQNKASSYLYWPESGGLRSNFTRLRMLHLASYFALSYLWLATWSLAFLLLGGICFQDFFTFIIPTIVLIRTGGKAGVLGAQDLILERKAGRFRLHECLPLYLQKKPTVFEGLKRFMLWLTYLTDFYGYSEVWREPSLEDFDLFISPLGDSRKCGQPSSRCTDIEMELQTPLHVSRHFTDEENPQTHTHPDLPFDQSELARETSEFALSPMRGCWFCMSAVCKSLVACCLNGIDGSLTFLSMGILSMLSGHPLAAGYLLSNSAVFAATCFFMTKISPKAKTWVHGLLFRPEAQLQNLWGAQIDAQGMYARTHTHTHTDTRSNHSTPTTDSQTEKCPPTSHNISSDFRPEMLSYGVPDVEMDDARIFADPNSHTDAHTHPSDISFEPLKKAEYAHDAYARMSENFEGDSSDAYSPISRGSA